MDTKIEERYGMRPTTIEKVVRVGSYQDDYFKSKLPVFCKITYNDGRLSISGVVAPLANGDARGSCGQMYDSISENLEAFDFADGWDKVKAFTFVEYWKHWHLNDMRAGCEHQRALGWKSYDEHPSEPCPTCGYKFGSAWLTEEVPTKVLQWLEALPNSDRVQAWI